MSESPFTSLWQSDAYNQLCFLNDLDDECNLNLSFPTSEITRSQIHHGK